MTSGDRAGDYRARCRNERGGVPSRRVPGGALVVVSPGAEAHRHRALARAVFCYPLFLWDWLFGH